MTVSHKQDGILSRIYWLSRSIHNDYASSPIILRLYQLTTNLQSYLLRTRRQGMIFEVLDACSNDQARRIWLV